jgi:hypothetical protein
MQVISNSMQGVYATTYRVFAPMLERPCLKFSAAWITIFAKADA